MSDFLESPLARSQLQPGQARTLEMLTTLFLVAFVVATLYIGREIFIPIAIAILGEFCVVAANSPAAALGFGSCSIRLDRRFYSACHCIFG